MARLNLKEKINKEKLSRAKRNIFKTLETKSIF